MNLPLPDDIQQLIDAQIAMGMFANEEAVLREALLTLERRQRGLKQMQEMIAVAEEDWKAGRVAKLDREQLKQEVRERLAERGIGD